MPTSACLRAVLMAPLAVALSACSLWPFGENGDQAAANGAARPSIAFEVQGVEGRLADNVRAHATLASKPCDTAPAYVRALAARAEEETRDALRAFGYYQAEVSVALDTAGDCPRAVVSVKRGRRVTLREVEVRVSGPGENDVAFERAIANLPLTPGAGLSHARYSEAKSLIETLALERGYLDGRFTTSRLAVDPHAGTADVTLVFASGTRYGVGPVRIDEQPDRLNESLIRRFLDYSPGAPYNSSLVTRFYTALSASEYFESVEVRPLLSQPDGETIPIDIALTPRKQHKYAAGLGASTDEGIRGRINYANRRINRHGHRVSAELRASLIEQRLQGAYQIPRTHPADEWLSIQAGVRREDLDSFDTIESRLGASETKRRPWGWMETRFVDLNHQIFDVGGDSGTTTLLIPGLRWAKTTSNDPLYPTRGWALEFEVRGASDAIISDVSFARASVSASAVYGLPAGMRLLTRLDAGTSWIDQFDELPPTERFFAGGDNSIRGFGFEDLGPEDADGKVIGGKHLAVASLELEKFFTDKWGGAVFVDAGNAFGGAGSSTGVKVGVGAGVRWRSPVGPARVDLAHPLDDDTIVRLHLRIGPDL